MVSDFSFIDMHIHSKHSDEDFCDLTVEEILTKAQKKSKKLGRPCVISIADHNSMLASKEAQAFINTGKFPNVKLINGMELTVDMCEINQKVGQEIFKRVHILAYNFSENNPELLAYSKVTHIHFEGYDENVGLQICSARRVINEKYGITIPFKALIALTNLKRTSNVREEFLDVVMPYLDKKGIKADRQEIKALIKPYIKNYVSHLERAEVCGRLTISEASRLIKNAGGELVVAHPAKIHICVDGANQLLMENGLRKESSKYKSKAVTLENLKNKDFLLEVLINNINSIGQTKVKGIEAYNITGLKRGTSYTVDRIANKFGLYKTAGSDYHGDVLTDDRDVGNVFIDEAHASARSFYTKQESDDEYLYVSSLPCIDYFNGKPINECGVVHFVTKDNRTLTEKDFANLHEDIRERKHKRHAERIKKANTEQDDEDVQHKNKVKVRIGDLVKIVEETNILVYTSNQSPSKKISKLVQLNKFAEKLYVGIDKLVAEGTLDKETLDHIRHQVISARKNLTELAKKYPSVAKGYAKSVKNDKNIVADWLNCLVNVNLEGR